MPKLYSSAEIIRVLERNGFAFVAQRGSHIKFRCGSRVVIVPANRREIPMGTFRSILRQSGLSDADFS
ncbi:MAG: type II toxin-antitoxin system HicA family toxin [bacterium]|nr:type II toxin-antitoxin system HicA family toxin [bacterium]